MINRICGLCVLLAVFFALMPISARAQVASSASLSAPLLDKFPRIQVYLDVRDAQSNFIQNLQDTDVRILEDDQSLPAESLNQLRSGVQFVAAISPGSSFAVRNSQGISRYDFIIEALTRWGQSRIGSTLDDWSLVTTGGSETLHVEDPNDWLAALQKDKIEARDAKPSLETLSRAIDIAADPTARPGMGRAVLFISPPVEGINDLALQNLTSRASQQSVHIFIWLVTPRGAPATQGTNRLQQLCQDTGGQLANVSGEEDFPNPEGYLDPLRSIYQLVYLSKIKTSGAHSLQVEIQTPDGGLTAGPRSFDLDIQPPDPAFVSPPLQIIRVAPQDRAGSQQPDQIPSQEYLPASQQLQILVDFPDGRARPLAKTELYVDGTLQDSHTQPPFEQFTWDLSSYAVSGEHLLQVRAEDSLGLSGASIETAVQVTVQRPRLELGLALLRRMPVLLGLAVLVSGALVMLALILGGRIRPHTWAIPQRIRRRSEPPGPPASPSREQAARHLPNWVTRLQWHPRRVTPQAHAFLSRGIEDGSEITPAPIPLTGGEITLGRDPHQATLVLEDLSVDALHARLIYREDGSFYIKDEGSIAGTWINYTPVPPQGARLEHGDWINIGRIGLRFTLNHPQLLKKPVVKLDRETQEHRA